MRVLVLVASVAVAVAQRKTWRIQNENLATALLGIAFADERHGWTVGAADGSGGLALGTRDGGNTWNTLEHDPIDPQLPPPLMYMATAAHSFDSAVINGPSILGLFGKIEHSSTGTRFHDSVVEGNIFVAVSPTHETIRGVRGGYAMVGQFDDIEGVAVSIDGGRTYRRIPVPVGSGDNQCALPASFGAFPSGQTWYVTGSFVPDNVRAQEDNTTYALRHNIHLKKEGGNIRVAFTDAQSDSAVKAVNNNRKLLQDEPVRAAICKTTDGGATWRTVYNSVGEMYFNNMHCADENICMVTGSGPASAGMPGVTILRTQDGGASWQTSMRQADPNFSLMDVHMLNRQEAWAGGGHIRAEFPIIYVSGIFWHTLDGGQTWTEQRVGLAMPNKLTFGRTPTGDYQGWASAFVFSENGSIGGGILTTLPPLAGEEEKKNE